MVNLLLWLAQDHIHVARHVAAAIDELLDVVDIAAWHNDGPTLDCDLGVHGFLLKFARPVDITIADVLLRITKENPLGRQDARWHFNQIGVQLHVPRAQVINALFGFLQTSIKVHQSLNATLRTQARMLAHILH